MLKINFMTIGFFSIKCYAFISDRHICRPTKIIENLCFNKIEGYVLYERCERKYILSIMPKSIFSCP